jgi:hypothetical protein
MHNIEFRGRITGKATVEIRGRWYSVDFIIEGSIADSGACSACSKTLQANAAGLLGEKINTSISEYKDRNGQTLAHQLVINELENILERKFMTKQIICQDCHGLAFTRMLKSIPRIEIDLNLE